MERRDDIDRAKGLAILLVVFGHLVARADPARVAWYEPLRRAVYAIHMPFFLYLSGLVAVLSGMLLAPRANWPRLVKSRARRLLLPFFGLGGLIVLGKILAARGMVVDNIPAGIDSGFYDLVWRTAYSPALSIWYLFVLFVVSLGFMLLLGGSVRASPFCWDVAWCSTCCPCRLIYIWTVSEPMRCFSVAVLGREFWARAGTDSWTGDGRCCWRYCSVGWLGVAWFGASLPEKILLLPLGVLAMPALHGLLRCYGATSPRVFLVLGRYSFMIYLFNTIFIGLTKGILLHFCSWDGPHFLPFAMVLMTSGILGPVMLKQKIFRHVSVLDRLTD